MEKENVSYEKIKVTEKGNKSKLFFVKCLNKEMILIMVSCDVIAIRNFEYAVWPPAALITAVQRLLIKRHSLLMSICCTSFQALTRACSSCWGVLGCGTWLLTCLSILSHRCSLGLRSRDIAGHGSTLMLFSVKKFWVTIAACGRALSCWNVT